MSPRRLKFSQGVISVWKSVFSLLLANPKIFLPFCILTLLELSVLGILSCSSHFPVRFLLAPPIRHIWGDVYLHYPYLYELLPRLFYYAKIILSVVVGSIGTTMAVVMVWRHIQDRQAITLKEALKAVWPRYVSLVLVSAVLFAAAHFVMKQPLLLLQRFFHGHEKLLFLKPVFWLFVFLPIVRFVLVVLLQGVFAYAIPSVAIGGRKFFAALLESFRLFFKMPIKTLLVFSCPLVLYIPVTMLDSNAGFLANKFAPEIVRLVLAIDILVGTAVVDTLLTVATVFLFSEIFQKAKPHES